MIFMRHLAVCWTGTCSAVLYCWRAEKKVKLHQRLIYGLWLHSNCRLYPQKVVKYRCVEIWKLHYAWKCTVGLTLCSIGNCHWIPVWFPMATQRGTSGSRLKFLPVWIEICTSLKFQFNLSKMIKIPRNNREKNLKRQNEEVQDRDFFILPQTDEYFVNSSVNVFPNKLWLKEPWIYWIYWNKQ